MKFLQSRKYRMPGDEDGAGDSASVDTDVSTDWGDMSSDTEESSVDVTPAAAPETTVQPVTPAATPEVVTPVAPVAAEPVVQPQAQQEIPQAQPDAPAPDVAALRADYSAQLQKYYALDDEDAQRLQTEPELVLPQLAAKVHLEVLDAVMAQLPQRIAMTIAHHNQSSKVEAEAEDIFFKDFPDLREHKDAVLRVGQMFRAANPKATKEQAVKSIGEFVRQSLGLVAPTASEPPPLPQPFVPAGGSGGGAVVPTPSLWDEMVAED